jgi:hypothetical protein
MIAEQHVHVHQRGWRVDRGDVGLAVVEAEEGGQFTIHRFEFHDAVMSIPWVSVSTALVNCAAPDMRSARMSPMFGSGIEATGQHDAIVDIDLVDVDGERQHVGGAR